MRILRARRAHVDQLVRHNRKPPDYIMSEPTDQFLSSSSSFPSRQPTNFLISLIYGLPSLSFLLNCEWPQAWSSFKRIFIIAIILALLRLLRSHFFGLGSNKYYSSTTSVSLLYPSARIRRWACGYYSLRIHFAYGGIGSIITIIRFRDSSIRLLFCRLVS